jgi:hypothetical protein
MNAFAAPGGFPQARPGERIVDHGGPVRETEKIAVVRDGPPR